MNPIISLMHAGFTYDPGKRNARTVFANVDLEVEEGEILGVTGVSGHGKTTLLKVMAGLVQPTSGSVEVCGTLTQAVSKPGLTKLRKRNCGLVTQRGDLNPYLTVLDNVVKTTRFCTGRSVSTSRAEQLLRDMGLDPSIDKRLPGTLSGGERQRVAVAVAIAGEPNILFADEPTSALDPDSEQLVLDAILATKKSATTIVIVSHHVEMVRSFCGRAVFMQNGQITPV